ncbi:MAG: NADPH-dependent 7-cyano-7-deazaguanine reductase QueF [Planctomycetota bacterium]|nr:MAG: NADPH-dependent 7-cyano-7-deazaguanine reductase QueF [Planctomycetota bacterium]
MAGSKLRRGPYGLDVFDNPRPGRAYVIRHEAPEFTSVCPVTGQPDFGTVIIEYVPDKLCVELKSLKFYLQAFRNEGIYYEDVTNRILDELVAAVRPRWMRVETRWRPRGGMSSVVTAEYEKRPRRSKTTRS